MAICSNKFKQKHKCFFVCFLECKYASLDRPRSASPKRPGRLEDYFISQKFYSTINNDDDASNLGNVASVDKSKQRIEVKLPTFEGGKSPRQTFTMPRYIELNNILLSCRKTETYHKNVLYNVITSKSLVYIETHRLISLFFSGVQ